MSEPTPLNAEELADGDDFDTCSFGFDHDAIDRALAEQDATIDALTTENATPKAEIEGYRQALEAVGSRARAAMEGQRG